MGDCNCKHGTKGTATACPECDIPQLARNNYFTGKLLVERDFTDEQRYTMGKLRRHNQRLHGWGVACGFKVKEHPNPACQSQYVIVEPGTAIDCCGREILLSCEEYFDFEAKFLNYWQKQNGPNSPPDKKAHTLQICVSYKECATENVPAIFDDCSGGAGACQPNRILEGRGFDLIVDPASAIEDPQGVSLKWDFTTNIANVQRVAEDDSSNRLYVLTSATSGSISTAALYVFDTTNYTLAASVTFAGSQGLDVAVSPAGDFVYVLVQPATGAPQINVYKSTDFTATTNQQPVGTASDPTLRLATYPGVEGSLFAFGKTAGVLDFDGVNASGGTSTTIASIDKPVAMAVSEKNQYAYAAVDGSKTISVIKLATSTVDSATIVLPTAPTSLAIAATADGETLAALDASGGNLYFVEIPPAGPAQAKVVSHTETHFDHLPKQVLLSPGGRWAYVLEENATTKKAYVQAVDKHAVKSGQGNAVKSAVEVGIGPLNEAISQDGSQLYIAFSKPSHPDQAGVAIVEVTETECEEILRTALDRCPDCDQGDCLILATVSGYVYGNAIINSEIDNLKDRRLLVSTDILSKAVQCLIEQSASGTNGEQGPVGPAGATGATGPAGPGLEQELVQISALSWTHGQSSLVGDLLQVTLSAPLTAAANGPGTGITTYSGTFSAPLPVGAEATIAGFSNSANNGAFSIVSCSSTELSVDNPKGVAETHAATATALSSPAFVLAFSGEGIQMPDAPDASHIFQVLIDPAFRSDQAEGYENPCAVAGSIIAVNPTISGTLVSSATQIAVAPGSPASALAFVLDSTKTWYAELVVLQDVPGLSLNVWVRLRGDFLLDTGATPRAISAEFVRYQLPTGERPPGSGFCLEGGTFESWITLVSGAGK